MTGLEVRIQPTPNPMAVKFVVDRDLKVGGKVSVNDPNTVAHVPLARLLLQVPGVIQVHFFENAVTITQDGSQSWHDLEFDVSEVLKDNIANHDPNFDLTDAAKPKRDKESLSPDLRAIDDILERTIRPGLQADGGDVELVELDGDILTIRYEGACGGCPSSMMGTLQAIQGILRDEFRPELLVVAI
jgi:Fe-S cluster biogenesis protein NfuA